jgi:hypothetical protein
VLSISNIGTFAGWRYPTPVEALAGLLLIDAETALLVYVANEIRVGDRSTTRTCPRS